MATVVGSSYSTAPGSSSVVDLRAQVARYVKMPNAAQGLQIAEQHIKSAIAKINTRDWQFLLTSDDLTTAASAEYTLSNDFNKPRHLHVLDSSGNKAYVLGYLDPKSFDYEIDSVTTPGVRPRCYTVYSKLDTGVLTLDRAPDSTFVTNYPTLRLRYYKYLQYPASSGSHLGVTSEVELFIIWYAKALMASDFMPQKYALARSEAEDIWQALIRNDHTFTDWD